MTERGMVVGARRAGLSISQTADLLGFSRTTISRVYREWSEKEKTSLAFLCAICINQSVNELPDVLFRCVLLRLQVPLYY